MRLSKKKMLAELEPRYLCLSYDETNKNKISLYDKERPHRCMATADYVATVELDPAHGKYLFNGEAFETVESLTEAIGKHIETLPYYHGYYDPMYRKSWVVGQVIHDYLIEIGFVIVTRRFESVYCIKDSFGNELFSLNYKVDDDSTSGEIYRILKDDSLVTSKFNDIDSAIGAINGIMMELLADAAKSVSIISKITGSVDLTGMKRVKISGFDVVVEEQKEKIINILEKQLEELKK